MDRVFGGPEWREIAVDSALADNRTERERRYVQLFLDQVIGERHRWKAYLEVRSDYMSTVKYWLIHASDDEAAYRLMNDEGVKVNDMLYRRDHVLDGVLDGFAEVALEAHHETTMRELEAAIHECVQNAGGGEIPFGVLRRKLSPRFFGRVRWTGGYSTAIRNLCEAAHLEREEPKMRSKFEADEVIRATAPEPGPDAGAKIVALKRVA